MFSRLHIHPANPQANRLQHVVETLSAAGVVALPTDSSYALVCLAGEKTALDRIRAIRGIDDRHHMTLMCSDLSQIALYAKVDNAQYRYLKNATPGPYTFLLEGTKELPRRILHPKRKTIGLRIPDSPLVLALLALLSAPLLSCSLILPDDDAPLSTADDIDDRLNKRIDVLVDSGVSGGQPTSVVDLTTGTPQLIRAGSGDLSRLGF